MQTDEDPVAERSGRAESYQACLHSLLSLDRSCANGASAARTGSL